MTNQSLSDKIFEIQYQKSLRRIKELINKLYNKMDSLHIINFHPIFSECAECLSKRLGLDIIINALPISGHTYIIFGSHTQASMLYSRQIQTRGIKYIIINGEPPQSNVLKNKYYIELMRNNVVFDYHPISTAYLKSLDIRVLSHYNFEFPANLQNNCPRDIDVLFIGTYNKRRADIFDTLKKHYPEKHIVFHLEWKHSDQSELTKELCRAKIVLNIPYYESGILETHRINKALSCGCKVVSLYSGHAQTDQFYASYIYMCRDFLTLFNNREVPTQTKKMGHEHLINSLASNFAHNKTIIEQLIKK